MTAYIVRRYHGLDQDEALQEYDRTTEQNLMASAYASRILCVIYVLRGIFFAALVFCGASFWIIVSLVTAYLVRAELTSVKVGDTGREFVPAEPECCRWHWYIAAGLIFLVSLGSYTHLLGGIAAL